MTSRETEGAFSVKQLSDILTECFHAHGFQSLKVYGEVYSIKLGKFSYLEIGDQGVNQVKSPILKCAFSFYYDGDTPLEQIKVGDVVLIEGSLSYYAHGSSLTLWGKKLTLLLSQEGKTMLEKKKILERLSKAGYLDPARKRKIPKYVKKVAILTAEKGAAYQDILKTLHSRFPVSSVLYPVTVQGEKAASSMVAALEKARNSDCDVVLLGRGGGDKTDLSCFDDEKLALAIARFPKPVITCIGHTIDTSIADRVSDLQAITPTEGASLINPSLEETNRNRENFKLLLKKEFSSILDEKARSLASIEERLEALSPKGRIKAEVERKKNFDTKLNSLYSSILSKKKNELANLFLLLRGSYQGVLKEKEKKLASYLASLSAFDPERIKKSGYALLYKDGKKIDRAGDLKKGDKIVITYPDGRKEAIIL